MKITIIGKGNVAVNFLQAFQQQGVAATMIDSRDGLDQIDPSSDVYLYAVRDSALETVAGQVNVNARALHIHTSGTMPLSVFGSKQHTGIIYPFMTFKKDAPLPNLQTVPLFVQAEHIDDLAAIYSLAQNLSPYVYEINQTEREKLHLAGVFANNFTNLMYTIAGDMLSKTHIPFSVLLPIIDRTAQAVHTIPPNTAQTGPAIRQDTAVMQHHIKLIDDPQLQHIYTALSEYIMSKSNVSAEK